MEAPNRRSGTISPTPLDLRIGMEARRIRDHRRRAVLRWLGFRAAFVFILLFGGLGSYYAFATPGIPRIYAVGFVLANGVVLRALRGAIHGKGFHFLHRGRTSPGN
jgi:hypothetical protein